MTVKSFKVDENNNIEKTKPFDMSENKQVELAEKLKQEQQEKK